MVDPLAPLTERDEGRDGVVQVDVVAGDVADGVRVEGPGLQLIHSGTYLVFVELLHRGSINPVGTLRSQSAYNAVKIVERCSIWDRLLKVTVPLGCLSP